MNISSEKQRIHRKTKNPGFCSRLWFVLFIATVLSLNAFVVFLINVRVGCASRQDLDAGWLLELLWFWQEIRPPISSPVLGFDGLAGV